MTEQVATDKAMHVVLAKRELRPMTIELFAHPFSSYCQKAITAFYENNMPFELRLLEPGSPRQRGIRRDLADRQLSGAARGGARGARSDA